MARLQHNRGLFKTKSWELTVQKLLRNRPRRPRNKKNDDNNNNNKENKLVGKTVYAHLPEGDDSSLNGLFGMDGKPKDGYCSSLVVETSFYADELDDADFPTTEVCFGEQYDDDDEDDGEISSDITLDSVWAGIVPKNDKLTTPLRTSSTTTNEPTLFRRSPPMFGLTFGVEPSSDEFDTSQASNDLLGATPLFANQKVRRSSLIRFRK